MRRLLVPLLGLATLGLAACSARPASRAWPPVAPPLRHVQNAYESAAAPSLAPQRPGEEAGLRNVFRLSGNVISGGEPGTPAALARLADWGVRTIVSVDGKLPPVEAAAALGLRYVHLPIHYSGLTPEEMAQLAKTFRELEGPFYVHCFHGRHRGPAAAAVGRLVLDGASRELVLAEMRQWCGTSQRYEGLYRSLAADPVPSRDETAALTFDFPAASPAADLRQAMVAISRAHDHLERLAEHGFEPEAEHPDIDAQAQAGQLLQAFERALELDRVRAGPQDLRRWMEDSTRAARALLEGLGPYAPGGQRDPAARRRAVDALERLAQNCAACHGAYRDR